MAGIFPPGLRGYMAAEEANRQQGDSNLRQAIGIMNLGHQARLAAMEEQAQPMKLGIMKAQLEAAQNPAPLVKDLGGSYGIFNPRTMQPMSEIPKTATPDALVKANAPKLEKVAVAGQPGVTQSMWLRPGDTSGPMVGGQSMPEILNPAVQSAKVQVAQAGRPLVNVSMSTEKKYGEQFAGKIAESDVGMRDAAMKAPDLAARSNRIMQMLNTGAITGAGADFRLQFDKALALAGVTDGSKAANTETLAASMAENTLDAIKASGLGSGSGFSNADREFLEKAKGGKITMERESLSRLAELQHKAAVGAATNWNARVKQIPGSALEGTGIQTTPVEVPGLYGRRAGDAGRGPKVGTIENGYEYLGGDPALPNSWKQR